jgi:hypothetical protein
MKKINVRKLQQELQNKNQEVGSKINPVPKEEWPQNLLFKPLRVWRSREFLVQEYIENNHIRISVTDARKVHGFGKEDFKFGKAITWDELQWIKRQIGYGDRCAVEIFPPDHLIINVRNMRHLWILPEVPAYCWGAKQ